MSEGTAKVLEQTPPAGAPPAKHSKKARVVCGLCVAAVWLIAIFLLPIWALAGLVGLSAIVCLYELCAMLRKAGYALPIGWLAAATAAWFAYVYTCLWRLAGLSGDGAAVGPSAIVGAFVSLALFAVIVAALFFRVLLDSRVRKPMETATLTVGAFVYIPFMLAFLLPIAMWPAGDSHSAGVFLAFALILVTKLSDTGGYFIGTAFGRHKMCPRLSPGKSWEGTAGGYAFSLIGAGCVIAAARIWPDAPCLALVRKLTAGWFGLAWALLTVAVLVTVGICGDLLESLFKRQCGVKDSSALFPAMGGFFDTFDSLIFIPAVATLMIVLGAGLQALLSL